MLEYSSSPPAKPPPERGKQPKDNIYINVVYAVDGAWNFGGKALTDAQIGEAVGKGG